jgi:hypothetical protein
MLQRLDSFHDLDEELLNGDGVWPRNRLEQMNAAFVAAVEAALEAGSESLVAARATVQVDRNGKAAAFEGALEGAWKSLCERKGQMLAFEVVGYVRERCPDADVFNIRFGMEQRLRQRGALW